MSDRPVSVLELTGNDRADLVADAINAGLPAPYRDALRDEARRVAAEILAPRGLPRRKVLLIGGAGYIGTAITPHLLERGYAVRCLDALLYGNGASVHGLIGRAGYEFLHGDFTQPDIVERAMEGVTDVVILAGLVGDPITKKYPTASRRINLDGMLALLGRLDGRGLNAVVFISTCSNYGLIPDNAMADENYELNPLSHYAEAKVAVETALLDLRGAVDYPATILRFATAFGLSPRMRFDLTVNEFTRELHLGQELLVYDADTWRPYCHVQDFAEVIRRVLEAPRERVAFEVFNAGGDANNFTKRMIVDAIQDRIPAGSIRYGRSGGDPRNYRVDFARIRDRLHFEPRYSVPDGIAEIADAMDQGLFAPFDGREPLFGNYAIDDDQDATAER